MSKKIIRFCDRCNEKIEGDTFWSKDDVDYHIGCMPDGVKFPEPIILKTGQKVKLLGGNLHGEIATFDHVKIDLTTADYNQVMLVFITEDKEWRSNINVRNLLGSFELVEGE